MKYYLPINSTSLAHYFSCACIKPAKFLDNKPQDVQDTFQDALLISTVLGTRDSDCCLELILTFDEERYLKDCGNGFYLLYLPLPISRVKKVFFKNPRQLETTLSNINLSAAFIPDSLAEVATFSDFIFSPAYEINNKENSDFSQQVALFDRILGALALMKIAKEPYMNYSENYASTLSFFCRKVGEDLNRQNIKIADKFFDLFARKGKFTKYLPYLEKKITKEDLDQIAADNNQSIERSYTKLIKFDKLNGITYVFAILQSYGVGGEAATQKIDGLISNNFNDLKDGIAEGIALYYGYNRGYSVFSNSYGTEKTGKKNVKFFLDSQLDYYTIESVYQFVFNNNTISSRYPYLDEWCPRKRQFAKRRTDYLILDTVFIGKKKPSVFSREYFQAFLAEVKAMNIWSLSLTSLVEQILSKVANDTKEEIEDDATNKLTAVEAAWAAKIDVVNAEITSLKATIDSQDAIIKDLQVQNNMLVNEVESLKNSSSNCAPLRESIIQEYKVKEEEIASVLREPEAHSTHDDEIKFASTTDAVSGYSPAKKSSKTAKPKTKQTRAKSRSKSEMQSSNDAPIDFIETNDGDLPRLPGM